MAHADRRSSRPIPSGTRPAVFPVGRAWRRPSGHRREMSGHAKVRLRLSHLRTASSMTVRFRRPRKSILRRPSSSRVVMGYWVTMVSSLLASGHIVLDRLGGDNHPGGVGGGVPGHPLHLPGHVEQLLHLLVRLVQLLAGLGQSSQRLVQGDLGRRRASAWPPASVIGIGAVPSAGPHPGWRPWAAMVPKVTIWATWSAPYLPHRRSR